jgi:hypothetical protein
LHGKYYRCEGEKGHVSAHFADDRWWPNKEGLPVSEPDQPISGWHAVAILLGAAVFIAAAVFALVHYIK